MIDKIKLSEGLMDPNRNHENFLNLNRYRNPLKK